LREPATFSSKWFISTLTGFDVVVVVVVVVAMSSP